MVDGSHGRSALPLLVLCALVSCHLLIPHAPAVDRGSGDLVDATRQPSEQRVADLPWPPPDTVEPTLGAFGPASKVGEGVISTAETEDDPTLTGDLLEIYFERQKEIYWAERPSIGAVWSVAAPVNALNTSAEEGTPEIAPDGLTLHFSSARQGGPVHVYVSTRSARGKPWSAPVPVPELSSAATDNCPTLSSSGRVMVLDSDRGIAGDRDLYLAQRATLGAAWSAPVPVAELNTLGKEDSSPWIDGTLRVLYFASDRGGNVDLWVATRPDPAAAFGAPSRVEGVNTAAPDSDPWLSPDLRTLYFTRTVGGNADIYMATR